MGEQDQERAGRMPEGAGADADAALFRQLAENVREVFWIGSTDWNRVYYVSPTYGEVWGRPPEELYADGRAWIDAVAPEDRQHVESAISTWAGDVSLAQRPLDYRVRRPDGSVRWLSARAFPVVDGAGRVYRVAGIAEDVTARKVAESRLRESEAKFRLLASNAPVGIFLTDAEGNCTFANRRWCQIAGMTQEQALGTGWTKGLHPDDRTWIDEAWYEAARSGKTFSLEYRFRTPGGRVTWVAGQAFMLRDEAGEATGYIGTITDITDRVLAESRLRALNETLEQRVSERTADVRRQSEHLRALAVQIGRAEQRERRRLASVLHDHVQQLLVAARLRTEALRSAVGAEGVGRVTALLDEAIDACRTLTGQLSPTVLYDAGLGAALRWLGRHMEQRHGLDVEVEVDGEVDPDDDDLRALLFDGTRELLFNVVKHAGTDRAGVRLAESAPGLLCVTVSDPGTGFDPAAPGREAEGQPGFGLLNIRERLLAMGGRMEVSSAVGQGTSVSMCVPYAKAAAAEYPGEEAPAGAGARSLRLLIADDHRIMREGLVSLLGSEPDIDVVGQAADGLEVVAMARRLRPDVVLMDVTMPRLDGVAAARTLAAEFPAMRIIGLSMLERHDMAEAMLAVGAACYLPKDGPSNVLLAAIRGHGPYLRPSAGKGNPD